MKPEYKAIGSFGTVGLEIALCIVAGVLGGQWLDSKLGTAPGLLVFGFICGLGAAGKAVFRTMKEMKEVTAQEEREQGNPSPRFEASERRAAGSRDATDATDARREDDHGRR